MKKNILYSAILAFFAIMMVANTGCKKYNFDDEYVAENKDKVYIEVPEVKELAMVVIALTDLAAKDEDLIYTKGSYYKDLQTHFGKYKNELVVKKFDAFMKNDRSTYFGFNADSYSYEFDGNGMIRRKKNFKSEGINYVNFITAHLDELQAFADKTNFRAFYKAHQPLYDSQSKYFRDTANFPKMVKWLSTNYPDVKYDCYRILFSPLVYGNQSTTGGQSNGFSEPHLHINFSYLSEKITKSDDIRRTPYLFTELNHNYENPEAEKAVNADRIKKSFADKYKWQDKNGAATPYYDGAIVVFEEYVNWALVSLWYWDNLSDKKLAEEHIKNMATRQVDYRGFTKFREFNAELLRLYKEKKTTETIASLYPKLLDWCEKQ
jgi:hypothetical protein